MTRRTHEWTVEDAAFVAAQWASGISQREIGAIFGHSNGSGISLIISEFLKIYGDLAPHSMVYGHPRKELVKGAIAKFIAGRNERGEWQ